MHYLEIATYLLIAVNTVTFIMFGLDKAAAEAGTRRISEAALLQLALLGGSPAAYLARRVFRHKTRKQPFVNRLRWVMVVQLLALAVLAGWWLSRPDAPLGAGEPRVIEHWDT